MHPIFQSGEYVTTPRLTQLDVPIIQGYTTGRLQSETTLNAQITSGGTAGTDELLIAFLENTGATPITVQFQTTEDRTVSGTRTNLGSAVSLVAYGQKTVALTPTAAYLEIQGVSGTGDLRVKLSGQTRWIECSLGKDEPAGFYPYAVLEPILPPVLGPTSPTDGPTQFNW